MNKDKNVRDDKINKLDKKIQIALLLSVVCMLLFAMCFPFFMVIDKWLAYAMFFIVFGLIMFLMFSFIFIRHDIYEL